ncbi:MAG: hypothetical protein HOK67_21935, partial [Deltaproteobacteria bacterium]|nr:hypothetical protein [Deltaproteobacteria bacterium]
MKLIIKMLQEAALIFFLTILAVSVSAVYGSVSRSVRFEHLSIEDGLSHSLVNNVLQGQRGFMWFGTNSGLNKYDGSEITVYTHNPNDPNSLSDNYVWYLYEDHAGTLWIGSWGGGLIRFDPVTETFVRYQHDEDNSRSLSNDNVWSICEDDNNELWIATEKGLNRFDPTSETFTRYLHDPNNLNSLSSNKLSHIKKGENGILWIGTYGAGFHKFDPVRGTFTHYRHDDNDPNSLSNDYVYYIFKDGAGMLWIGTEGGLNRFDPVSEAFTRYLHDEKDPQSLSHNTVLCIYEDSYKTFWVGTYGGGLNKFNPINQVFTRFQYNPKNEDSLSNNTVWSINEDHTKTLWFGTENGINKYDPGSYQFDLYQHLENDPNSLSENQVQAIFEDGTGILWVGTKGGGLNKLDRQGDIVERYQHNPDDPNSLSNNTVTAIRPDGKNGLWIGTQGGGLNRFDPESKTFTVYRHSPNIQNSLTGDAITDIAIDPFGAVWIATYGAGLNKFDPDKNHFQHYRSNENISDWVMTVYVDPKGIVWAGFEGNGLTRLDPIQNTFTNYKKASHRLSNNTVYAIYTDSADRTWVGTNGGLNLFNPFDETFTHYHQKNGLIGSSALAILEDDHGYLWITTEKGLSKLDPDRKTFRNYDAKDGLQSNMFILHSAYKNKDGQLFFGGIKGLNAINSGRLKDNPHIPPVYLTDFQLFNQTVPIGENSPLQKHINFVDKIRLSHKQSVFSIQFSALNYRHPEKNRYAYKMEGFDNNWTYTDGTRRFATYTNLDPGEYVFRVKGSNNDGLWNEEGTFLKLIVIPPWWKTLWFRAMMVMLTFGLVFAVFRWRMRDIRIHNRQLENQVAERTRSLIESKDEAEAAKEEAEIANRSKSTFLANMSHELRTPLNAILGFSQLMVHASDIPENHRDELRIINRSGEHLLGLINDVLEISKIEAGRAALSLTSFDLPYFLQGINEMFHSRTTAKSLRFIQESASDLPRFIRAEERKLRQVLINLLGNAVKFTDQGDVILRTSAGSPKRSRKGDKRQIALHFEVEDSGIGMTAEELRKVFEPFVQAGRSGDPTAGTGLGLAISWQYIDLMGGDISAESQPGRGSVFRFNIPIEEVEAVEERSDITFPNVTGLEPGQPEYRILIVEDLLENRILLRRFLESTGFMVREAVNGWEGIE